MVDRREQQQHYLKVAELGYTAFNAGKIEPVLKLCDDEVELVIAEGVDLDTGTWKGHDGIREWYSGAGELRAAVSEVLPVGVAHMVVLTDKCANLIDFGPGKIGAIHVLPGRDEAVAEAKKREADRGDD